MSKSLIIYFSRADENYAVGYITEGNTEIAAKYVSELTGADLFKVEPLVPYAKEYNICTRQAKERIGNAPVKDIPNDISGYDTIFVMTPIYWGTYAPELETVLKNLDFTDKKIRVITTHEGSGIANTVRDIQRICKRADVDENALAIRGSEVKNSKDKIKKWL